jgi:hypothetical protein
VKPIDFQFLGRLLRALPIRQQAAATGDGPVVDAAPPA